MLKRQVVSLSALIYISIAPTIETILWVSGWYDIFWMGFSLFVGFGALVALLRARSSPFWVAPYWGAVVLSVVIGIKMVLRFGLSWPWAIPAFVGIVATGLLLFFADQSSRTKSSSR